MQSKFGLMDYESLSDVFAQSSNTMLFDDGEVTNIAKVGAAMAGRRAREDLYLGIKKSHMKHFTYDFHLG